MDSIKLQEKLDHLRWLKHSGVEYYSSKEKDSINSQIDLLKEFHLKKESIVEPSSIDNSTPNVINEKPLPSVIARSGTQRSNPSDTKKCSDATRRARKLADSANTLSQLRNYVENFDGCSLKDFATNTVFSDGVENAKILLIGEAPGAKEDEQGIPFCGESGKLLDKMMAAIGLCRSKNIYITNTIFWRPPANRRPTNEEIGVCKPFVEKHIALIKPKLIILVGGTATTSLLGTNEGISHIRQNNHSYINQYLQEPIQTTAIFHPAYLLRQPMKKKDTWYDLLKIQKIIAAL